MAMVVSTVISWMARLLAWDLVWVCGKGEYKFAGQNTLEVQITSISQVKEYEFSTLYSSGSNPSSYDDADTSFLCGLTNLDLLSLWKARILLDLFFFLLGVLSCS